MTKLLTNYTPVGCRIYEEHLTAVVVAGTPVAIEVAFYDVHREPNYDHIR
ncbi:MAG: hypothetical protein IPM66_14600 [Acidobacteriota bacterium]|nr:MAG: hypothetical protein IPM66_14600 [Acidobacteriota bacterium]